MKSITYKTAGGETEILIGRGIAGKKESFLPLKGVMRAAIVTDSNVAPLYLDALCGVLKEELKVDSYVLPAGEESKTFASVEKLYSFFDRARITRTDLIIALGGGVVGDITGFAAATFLRGVRIIQVPTTLLAMTDSAIGGKTGVDLPSGKNRAGAFHQPVRVIVDPDFLETLPPEQYSCGMAEVIKYACIKDGALFNRLKRGDDNEDIIYTCAAIKAGVVQRDQFDSGERKLLNFGHTVGHAIERYYNYSGYNHGQAVAAGMCMLRNANMTLGGLSAAECDEIEDMCRKYGLPVRIDFGGDNPEEYFRTDKKLEGDTIKLVVLEKIGSAKIVQCTPAQLACLVMRQQ